jgi:hypothetical protein
MTKLALPEKMRISFDPDDPDSPTMKEDPLLKEVWADPLARNIWLCYAAQHIRDQNHTTQLLSMVKALRKDGHPRSPAHLASFLDRLRSHGVWGNDTHDMELAVLMWPYTNGEKDMPYEVVRRQP